MRIGIFTDSYHPHVSGVTTSIDMLKEALIKMGHKVFIVTVNPEDMKYHIEKNGTILRIPGIPTGIYDYRLTTLYPIKAVNIIKEWNLDVIHTHTEFGIGTFARVIGRQFDVPVVHTYHTMYEDYVHYITKGYFDGASKKIVEYLTKFYCDTTVSELIVPSRKIYNMFNLVIKSDDDSKVLLFYIPEKVTDRQLEFFLNNEMNFNNTYSKIGGFSLEIKEVKMERGIMEIRKLLTKKNKDNFIRK